MLAILNFISIVASLFTSLFEERGLYRKARKSIKLAIISGLLYSIPTIYKIVNNLFKPDFWTIFGFISFVFLTFCFLSGDRSNCLNYTFAAFLGSGILCFILSNFYYTDYLVECNVNHDYTKHVKIVTTVDGSESGESIYGDGYTIALLIKSNPNMRMYEYHYQSENGNILSKEIIERRCQINYIDAEQEPYVDIYYSVECLGCKKEAKTHVINSYTPYYHFYIPEDSIAEIFQRTD